MERLPRQAIDKLFIAGSDDSLVIMSIMELCRPALQAYLRTSRESGMMLVSATVALFRLSLSQASSFSLLSLTW
jgi:hypothetical protein